MAVKQKLYIDKSSLNNMQVVIKDKTGLYSVNNVGGYGGANGVFTEDIYKYIFELKDTNSSLKYKQIYGDGTEDPEEFQYPTVSEIQSGEEITFDANNFSIEKFNDSLYKLNMSAVTDYLYNGDGFVGQEIIVNVQSAESLYNNFQAIYADGEIYYIIDRFESTIFLDRPLESDFEEFYPVLTIFDYIILSDKLYECLDKKINKLDISCECLDNNEINDIARIQLLMWGIKLSSEKEDYNQANEYLDLCKKLCNSCCKC